MNMQESNASLTETTTGLRGVKPEFQSDTMTCNRQRQNSSMKNSLTLIRRPYEEPHHLNLIIEASNGHQTGTLEFYDNTQSLTLCANALEVFPKNNKDEFIWKLGSEDPNDRFAFFFRFHVCLVNAGGKSAINLRLNNNLAPPAQALSDFSIQCEPAGLNNLGRLFRRFSEFEGEVLRWNGISGEIT